MNNISKIIFGVICLVLAALIGFGDKIFGNNNAASNNPEPIEEIIEKISGSKNKYSKKETLAIIDLLKSAPKHGLDPIDLSNFTQTLAQDKNLSEEQETKLAEVLVKFAKDMNGGRINWAKTNRNWDMKPKDRDFAAELEAAHLNNTIQNWLLTLSPQTENYKGLLAAREHYSIINAKGGFTKLGDVSNLKLGVIDSKVALLRNRLAEEGFFAPVPQDNPLYFDAALKQALMLFQEAHGAMAPDGEIGEITKEKLNISAKDKIKQIDLNLERERWLPRDNPQSRVEANIPSAELNYFVNGALFMNMPTIVGAVRTKTPIFVSDIHTIVLNPPWYVPRSIKSRLRVHPPGPRNALGRVKFDLINNHSVFLHDTPNHAPFKSKIRALSHGCIRLDRPKDLAESLLAPEGITRDKIDEITQTVKTTRIKLTQSMPVYLLYRTTQFEKLSNGTMAIHFYKDIYNWDNELFLSLNPELKPKEIIPIEAKTIAAP